jgi:hypothetical protein
MFHFNFFVDLVRLDQHWQLPPTGFGMFPSPGIVPSIPGIPGSPPVLPSPPGPALPAPAVSFVPPVPLAAALGSESRLSDILG